MKKIACLVSWLLLLFVLFVVADDVVVTVESFLWVFVIFSYI